MKIMVLFEATSDFHGAEGSNELLVYLAQYPTRHS